MRSLTIVAALAVAFAGCGGSTAPGAVDGSPGLVAQVHGYSAEMTPSELAALADLVVVGTVESSNSHRYGDHPMWGVEVEIDPGLENGTYTASEFQVDEILFAADAADDLQSVIVYTHGSSDGVVIGGDDDESQQLAVGARFVIFLSEGETMWSAGYLVLEVGDVDANGNVTLRRDGTSFSMEELSDLVADPRGPATPAG